MSCSLKSVPNRNSNERICIFNITFFSMFCWWFCGTFPVSAFIFVLVFFAAVMHYHTVPSPTSAIQAVLAEALCCLCSVLGSTRTTPLWRSAGKSATFTEKRRHRAACTASLLSTTVSLIPFTRIIFSDQKKKHGSHPPSKVARGLKSSWKYFWMTKVQFSNLLYYPNSLGAAPKPCISCHGPFIVMYAPCQWILVKRRG